MYLFHCSLERTKHSFIFSPQSFHSLMAQYILLSNSFLAQRVSSPGFIAPLAWQRQLANLPFWFSNLCSAGPACKGPVYLSCAHGVLLYFLSIWRCNKCNTAKIKNQITVKAVKIFPRRTSYFMTTTDVSVCYIILSLEAVFASFWKSFTAFQYPVDVCVLLKNQ